MNEHRYTLASNKVPKSDCPYCGSRKHWQRYIDIETGEVIPEQHGRCDNEQKCGQWITPKDTGYAKMIWEHENGSCVEVPYNWKPQRTIKDPKPKPEPVYFDLDTFRYTLKPERFGMNTFVQNLLNKVPYPFEKGDVEEVIKMYRIGTVAYGYRAGAVTFPFIDKMNRVRAIQVKQFDEANNTTSTDFLHSIIEKHHTRCNTPLPEWLEEYTKQSTLVSCLFGEHLLHKYPNNPVALVEAPKTAIYGTLYYGIPENPDDLLWLAVYNKSSFSFEKISVLKGRDIYMFPDLSKDGSTFTQWRDKAKQIEFQLPGTTFLFSEILECKASAEEKQKGMDLADYLIKYDWRKFRKQEKTIIHTPESPSEEATPVPEESSPPKYQTVGDVFDIMKEMHGDELPPSCQGINAGIWKTQINPLKRKK